MGQLALRPILGAGMAGLAAGVVLDFIPDTAPGLYCLGYKVPRAPSPLSVNLLCDSRVSTKVNKTILLTLEELQVRGWQVTKLTITTGCDAIMGGKRKSCWSAGDWHLTPRLEGG